MQKNLDRMGGLVHSQRVLLALTQAGVSREDAYRLVQRNAMKVWESRRRAVAARPAQGRPRGDRGAERRRDRGRSSTSATICKHVDTIFDAGVRRQATIAPTIGTRRCNHASAICCCDQLSRDIAASHNAVGVCHAQLNRVHGGRSAASRIIAACNLGSAADPSAATPSALASWPSRASAIDSHAQRSLRAAARTS